MQAAGIVDLSNNGGERTRFGHLAIVKTKKNTNTNTNTSRQGGHKASKVQAAGMIDLSNNSSNRFRWIGKPDQVVTLDSKRQSPSKQQERDIVVYWQ